MDLNDELAELSYENRLLRQEMNNLRQEKLFFARRQAALSALVIAALIVGAALISHL